jgi:Uncharacterized protein conserved in bacteria (DUF2188)
VQYRLEKEQDSMPSKKPAVVTGPHPGGGWQNKVEGNSRASNVFETKAEAQAKGREMAEQRKTEHKIQNQDGRITERNSYGRDPYPPRG